MDKRETADRFIEAIERRDFATLEALIDPGFEFISVLAAVEGRTYHGIEGIRQWFVDLDEVSEDRQWGWEEFEELDGERGFLVARLRAKARGSGIPIDQTFPQIWRFRKGRVAAVQTFLDRDRARRAAGLAS